MIKKLLFPLLTVLIIIISTFLILEIFFKAQNYFIIKKGGNLKNYMITPRIYNQDYGWELKKIFNTLI